MTTAVRTIDHRFDDDAELGNETTSWRSAAADDDATRRVRSASAPLVTGERYQLGASIGMGGFGEIVSAYDSQIGRDVAIKRLRDRRPSREALARFFREARIQGRLEHPAIPPVHELAYDDAGLPYFVMKKLAGTTLARALRTPGGRERFSRPRLLRAFVDVCMAIELAHTCGIIHRDLKPSNILLGELGEVYVLDWGCARELIDGPRSSDEHELAIGDTTSPGHTVGTPGYMPPEQIRGARHLDPRTDVYALGCILFEILAGSKLHPTGEEGIRCTLLDYDARPSSRTLDEIPPELDELCVRATATIREHRVGSAGELGVAVQRFLDGDRDVALRARLAREHFAAARTALAGVPSEDVHRTAMREAGRALALDPTLTGAAELVGRLMLEPPRETPRAVVTELDAVAVASGKRQARIGMTVHAGYFLLAAILYVLGVSDPLYLGTLAGLSALNVGLAFVGSLRRPVWLVFTIIVTNLLIVSLFARMFSPFLVAPGIGAVSIMAFAFHPAATSGRALAVCTCLASVAVMAPWAAELAGLVPATTTIHDGSIFLLSTMDGIANLPVEVLLGGYVLALFAIAAALAFFVARNERTSRRQLLVQAWQLRQLLAS